ncbi:MAG: hypothetical protein WD335_00930 [Candidatus Paceibacterota bacterium]
MQKLILPITLIVLGIIAFFLYIKPVYQDTAAIRSEIEEYETALSQVGEIQKIRDDLLRQYNQLPQTSIYIMNRILPDSLDTVRLLVELNQMALPHNLSVQGISFTNRSDSEDNRNRNSEDAAPRKSYESAQTSFSVSGPYENVLDFVRDIERSTRLIDITRLTVTGPEADGEDGADITAEDLAGLTSLSGQENIYTITGMTYWFSNEDL